MLCTLVKSSWKKVPCVRNVPVSKVMQDILIRLIRSPQWRRIERVALNGKVSVFLI